MLKKITIPENFKTSQILFPKEMDLTLLPDPRIVPLFGPNGAGKTTLLKSIDDTIDILSGETDAKHALAESIAGLNGEDEAEYMKEVIDRELQRKGCRFESDGTPMRVLRYFNGEDNFRHRKARSMFESFDPLFISGRWDARSVSEGQSIVYSLFDLFELLGTGKNSYREEGKELLVLLDEFDSGLSLDNIGMFMRKMKNVIRKRPDVQIIFSFNNPYVLDFFPDVLSMYDGTVLHMKTAKDMLDEMNKNKKMFDKARRRSDGRPKVHD